MPRPALILASSSPRRRELIAEAGYDFVVVAPPEEAERGVCSEPGTRHTVFPGAGSPAGLVAELALRKAVAVRESLQRQGDTERGRQGAWADEGVIVAADTVAECDGFVLGKPRDEAAAREMLRQLRGRLHRVLTGLCVWPLARSEPVTRVAVTELRMDRLTDSQIDEYVATGQWEGKAGAFGYQDRLGWLHVVSGSESNVVGLPMELLAEMLGELGAG